LNVGLGMTSYPQMGIGPPYHIFGTGETRHFKFGLQIVDVFMKQLGNGEDIVTMEEYR